MRSAVRNRIVSGISLILLASCLSRLESPDPLSLPLNEASAGNSAPAIMFDPAAGHLPNDSVVRITAADGAKIFYTIDGTEPSLTGASSSSSVEVVSSGTNGDKVLIQAFAVSSDGIISVIYSSRYVIAGSMTGAIVTIVCKTSPSGLSNRNTNATLIPFEFKNHWNRWNVS